MDKAGAILMLFGLFTMSGAIFNWDWYMSGAPKFLEELFSRNGARIILGIAGFTICVVGLLMATKVIQ